MRRYITSVFVVILGVGVIAGQAAPSSAPEATSDRYAYGWTLLPSVQLKQNPSICPEDASLRLVEGCSAVIRDWAGAVLRTATNQLVITGGGHSGYSGNELYAVNLNASPVTFTRLNDPSVPGVGQCEGGFKEDGSHAAGQISGTAPVSFPVRFEEVEGKKYCRDCPVDAKGYGCAPSSKHNYAQLVYIPPNSTGCSGEMSGDLLWEFGGYDAWGSGSAKENAWVYHFDSKKWQRLDTWAKYEKGVKPGKATFGNVFDFDPVTKKIVMFTEVEQGAVGTLGEWDLCSNKYIEKARNDSWWKDTYMEGVLDPANRTLVITNRQGNDSKIRVYQLNTDTKKFEDVTATADAKGCGDALALFGGLTYDSQLKKIVMWPNAGSTVYDYDVKTSSCSAANFPGAAPPKPNFSYNGTFGRFRYVPDKNIYVLVVDWDTPTAVLCRDPNGCTK